MLMTCSFGGYYVLLLLSFDKAGEKASRQRKLLAFSWAMPYVPICKQAEKSCPGCVCNASSHLEWRPSLC